MFMRTLLSLIHLLRPLPIASDYTNVYKNVLTRVYNNLPIYYYGFLNNSLSNLNRITAKGSIKLECPENQIVNVTTVTFGDPPIDISSSIKCRKRVCVINSKDYVKKPFKYLTLSYECVVGESIKPLFDGNKFHPGVTPNYLILERDFGEESPDYNFTNSIEFMEKYREYPYLVWNGSKWTGGYGNWNNTKATTLVNYQQFNLSGYSVYLNYVAICNDVISCYEMDDVYSAYFECESSDCTFFTISFENQLSIKTKRAWICKGWPTIVPLKGHFAAVKCSAFDTINLNTFKINNK